MIKKILLLVIVVLGVGMAIPGTRAKMVESAQPLMNRVRAKMVPATLTSMADQLDARMKRGQPLPTGDAWSGWLERSFTGVPVDPWGNEWYLSVDRRSFTVASMGPDARPRTEDDLKESRRLPGR